MLKLLKKINIFLKKVRWIINNYLKKNEHIITPIKIKLVFVIKTLLFIGLYFYILKLLNVIKFNFHSWSFIKVIDLEFKDIFRDLVVAQIGSTFLTTAILSLVSSIEDKHILGEKTTNLLFGKRLLKFYMPMLTLYALMIINFILIINEEHSNFIIALFLLSIFILIYIINKIGTIFVTTKKYISILYAKYYRECEKNIINNIPPKDYESVLLINLKEETIRLIADNSNSYIKNINMYKVLIDRLLFNIPKELQKYHLNMTYAPSIINDFIELIEHFIYFKDLTRAIQYYNWLLARLNFHNIFISYENMNHIFEELANKLTDFKNEYETKLYLKSLSSLITGIEIQQHYAFTNDYTYTKFPKLRTDYIYHYNCKYFEIVYGNVFNNKYLSEKEKINCYTEIYEIFRLSAHNGCNIIRDITNFSFEFKSAKERKMRTCIVGQATALLLLRTILNKDDRSFKLFLGMNVEAEEMSFAIHLTLLSLIKMEKQKWNENIYNEFYGIDLEYSKDFINKNIDILFKNKLWDGKIVKEHLQDSYNYIYKECIEKEEKENGLFLEYIFKYDKKLVNQYFKKISKKYSTKIKVKEDADKDYDDIIDSYTK